MKRVRAKNCNVSECSRRSCSAELHRQHHTTNLQQLRPSFGQSDRQSVSFTMTVELIIYRIGIALIAGQSSISGRVNVLFTQAPALIWIDFCAQPL